MNESDLDDAAKMNKKCVEYVYKKIVDEDVSVKLQQPALHVRRVIHKQPWAVCRIPALLRDLQSHIKTLNTIAPNNICTSSVGKCAEITTDNLIYFKSLPDVSEIVCWYDCCPLTPECGVIPYPIDREIQHSKKRVTFTCIGYFCSWSCVLSYCSEIRPEFRRRREMTFIQDLMLIVDSIKSNGGACLMPRESLRMFGGIYSIDEWRKINLANWTRNVTGDICRITLNPARVAFIEQESGIARWYSNNMSDICAHISTYAQPALTDADECRLQQLWNSGQIEALSSISKRVKIPPQPKQSQSSKSKPAPKDTVVATPFRII